MTNKDNRPPAVLLIDDEEYALRSIDMSLKLSGIDNVICCSDERESMDLLDECPCSVVLLDLSMPHIPGEDLLNTLAQEYPDVPVIVVTGANEIDSAVRCMRNGAFDYMVKPVEEHRLISGVRRAMEFGGPHGELLHPEAFSGIVADSKAMRQVFQYAELVATTGQPVLITGETGVGKELIAKAVHRLSEREGPFITVNVAGLDEQMFSDTMFGHKKGAFTGATESRKGLVEKASGGTLFLDEIGDLSIQSQVKLLRLLQEREYTPLGQDEPRHTDARIIVATLHDLQSLQTSGKFRKDLYYRLCHHVIHIPPLRERLGDDLPLLIDHFLTKAAKTLGKRKPTPPKEITALLMLYDFPGNVRELESMIFDVVSRHKSGMLSLKAFEKYHPAKKQHSGGGEIQSQDNTTVIFPSRVLPTLKEVADKLTEEALKRSQGNQSIAARHLGVSRRTIGRRLQRRKH